MSIKFTKLSVLLPAIIGVLLGAAFFALGYTQGAPGACAMGLALAFGCVMLGVRNAGVINKGVFIPILLFCYAAGGIFLDLVVIMIAVGVTLLYRRKKHKK